MKVNGFEYVFDTIEQINRPSLYPGEDTTDWELPENIQTDFYSLNAIIENKYSNTCTYMFLEAIFTTVKK